MTARHEEHDGSAGRTAGRTAGHRVRRVLVANRGEIARRVFATCRRLGIDTVAVFSDADASLSFVTEADVAVRLPGSTPADTYLRGDLIVAAALQAGADAVHPGYGFLSENADFARDVIEAGLTWVGPHPDSIETMGSKIEAKKLMSDVGVPVLTEVSPVSVTEADLPLLVKASAGGGGRGMRVVRRLEEVAAAVEQASAEAASAFGDSTVFCEPYVEHGRHVEVQVLGDLHGSLVVLGERDCSIQRRHQKVIEETPAPGLSEALRQALHEAARTAASAIGYVGAGTVEFLLDPATEKFWFLEMNTRLQVEHTVTECVTGMDLVAAQIAVVEGRPIGELVGELVRAPGTPDGHAVQARLYAEDPAADWQPQSGRLSRFEVPHVDAEFTSPPTYGIRVDAGFESGNEVGTHYDAMLAKVIAWAPTREAAARMLAGVLSRARIHGVRTNRDLLVSILRDDAFIAGDVSTDFLDRLQLDRSDRDVRLEALVAAIALAERSRETRPVQQRIPSGWRNVPSAPQTTRFVCADSSLLSAASADESRVEARVEARWYGGRDGYRCADSPADSPGGAPADSPGGAPADSRGDSVDRQGIQVVSATRDRVVLDIGGLRTVFDVFVDGNRVDVESSQGHISLKRIPRFTDPADTVATGSLLAPMPGTVTRVAVAKGDPVDAGQTVLVLEAMKMQHTISAPRAGVVSQLDVAVGDQVAAGAVLAVVQTEEPEGETP